METATTKGGHQAVIWGRPNHTKDAATHRKTPHEAHTKARPARRAVGKNTHTHARAHGNILEDHWKILGRSCNCELAPALDLLGSVKSCRGRGGHNFGEPKLAKIRSGLLALQKCVSPTLPLTSLDPSSSRPSWQNPILSSQPAAPPPSWRERALPALPSGLGTQRPHTHLPTRPLETHLPTPR